MSLAGAMALTLAIGAAAGWPAPLYARIGHPVTWIRALIGLLDRRWNRGGRRRRLTAGAGCTALMVLAAALPAWALQQVLPEGGAGLILAGLLAWPLVAPLFWGGLLGLPGIAAYKAINTLDSMIGHRTPRHEAFGKAAARLDDLVNLIPARLTELLFAAVSARLGAALRVTARDARRHRSPNAGWPEALAGLAGRVGRLVVDESFADPHPEVSLAPRLTALGERVVILRSFAKFYGLAGLRLGFAVGGAETIARLRALAGPWAVSGPAIAAGRLALADRAWAAATAARLARDAARLDALAAGAGWPLVGGTGLFRTYHTGDAAAAQDRLARARIWTRRFPYSRGWLRLGLPGEATGWARLAAALQDDGGQG